MPTKPCTELFGPYAEALTAYLTQGRESDLARAHELGQTAMDRGVCASEVCTVHYETVCQLLRASKAGEGADFVSAAGAFLAESMLPFDAQQREVRRSNIALRYQNTKLENELRRFSDLVYDEALQLLAASRMALAGSNDKSAQGRGPLDAVESLLGRVEERLEAGSSRLRPRVLQDLGLGAAIHSLSRRFSESTKLDVKAEAAIGPLQPEVGIALYRAVLEALTNVHQHAHAKGVKISICEECSVLQCSIRDDGIGFDVSKILAQEDEQGSGLVSVSESLRAVGGTLVIESVPGGGTEIKISVCQRMQDEQLEFGKPSHTEES